MKAENLAAAIVDVVKKTTGPLRAELAELRGTNGRLEAEIATLKDRVLVLEAAVAVKPDPADR